MAQQEMKAAIAELKLTMTTEFVPWSQSRNAKPIPTRKLSDRSMNWRVTLLHDGHEVLTTDYMAGIAHCPSYWQMARETLHYAEQIAHETEKGYRATGFRTKIDPDLGDVLYSLTSDAEALYYGTFEEWAAGFGYEEDSRKAEGIYRACLTIGLKLRAALGDEGLAKLRLASQDY